MKSAVEQFTELASSPKFEGWPLVGEYELGEKIPFFGQSINYKLETGNGVEEYTSILRHFGWAVCFGVTENWNVVTLVQWKPGLNMASWELPPGGLGKTPPDSGGQQLLDVVQEVYLKETGYGAGKWDHLTSLCVESGKYRGANPDSNGLYCHLYMATDLVKMQDARAPNQNEIMETLEVPLEEFDDVICSGLFREISAFPCALLALRKLNR